MTAKRPMCGSCADASDTACGARPDGLSSDSSETALIFGGLAGKPTAYPHRQHARRQLFCRRARLARPFVVVPGRPHGEGAAVRLRIDDGTLLSLTISGQVAAKPMGSPLSSTYELLADDQFPTPTIRTARRKVRVVTAPCWAPSVCGTRRSRMTTRTRYERRRATADRRRRDHGDTGRRGDRDDPDRVPATPGRPET